MKPLCHLFAASLLTLATAAPAAAQDVAVLYTVSPLMNNCWGTDPQAKIAAVGYFASVDAIDVGVTTPTLVQLQAYEAVLLSQDYPGYQDPIALGDVLADYVDAGGGVVMAGFSNFSNWQPLGGGWATGAYDVIVASQQTSGQATLGVVYDPQHLSMLLVNSFDGGPSSFRASGATIAPGATRIADWSDGTPLVAQGANPRRVDLGFFPPSSDCNAMFGWDASTDGDLLMANSLLSVIAAVGTQLATNTTFGTGCGGQSLVGVTRPITGLSWDLDLIGTPANAVLGLVLLDTVNPNLAIGPAAPGCFLYSGGLLITPLLLPLGSPSFSFGMPQTPSLVGQTVFAQGGALVPGANPLGISASNGLEGLIGDF